MSSWIFWRWINGQGELIFFVRRGETESTSYCGHFWAYCTYCTLMIDDDGECGAVGGMRICRENRSTRRKPAPVPLCPPQIPHAWPGIEPGRRGGKPATNRLSYGTAKGWETFDSTLWAFCCSQNATLYIYIYTHTHARARRLVTGWMAEESEFESR
jgi:hypothetical protein